MKASEIEVGGIYTAKVSGKIARVRVDDKVPRFRLRDGVEWTEYRCTNLETRRQIRIKSCQRFRQRVQPKEMSYEHPA